MNVIEEKELLNLALKSGILNMDTIQKQVEMTEREKIINKHPYSIWKGKNGLWYTYIPSVMKGRVLKKRKTEEEIKSVVVDYWRTVQGGVTIESVFMDWNNYRLNNKQISDGTYTRNYNLFKKHFSDFGKRMIKNTTPTQWIEFLESQVSLHNMKAKAFSNLKCIVKGILKFAKRREYINFYVHEVLEELDVSKNMFNRDIKDEEKQVFSETEYPMMINYLCNNITMYNLAILLMLVTGIRIGECVALKYSDFLPDDHSVFKIYRTETRYKILETNKYTHAIKEFPKTQAGIRTVIIPEDYSWLYDEIKKITGHREFLFYNQDFTRRVYADNIRDHMAWICEHTLKIGRKSPHMARKTYGSILLDNGIDKNLITGQMGHVQISTTETFYHKNRKTIKTKQNILNTITDFKYSNIGDEAKEQRESQAF